MSGRRAPQQRPLPLSDAPRGSSGSLPQRGVVGVAVIEQHFLCDVQEHVGAKVDVAQHFQRHFHLPPLPPLLVVLLRYL